MIIKVVRWKAKLDGGFMCGRYNLTADSKRIIEHFQLQRLPRYEASYNIPPGQKIPAIVQLDDGSYKTVFLFWGLIPHWSKDRKISSHLFNARAETLVDKPAFKTAYRLRRCLIPATGFYEWQRLDEGKQAFHIFHKDNQLFAFAGLWEYWENESETVYSCTIITIAANNLIRPIHNRMPVIIDQPDYKAWLDKQTSIETIDRLLACDVYRDMVVKPVSDWVNNPKHNDKNCLN